MTQSAYQHSKLTPSLDATHLLYPSASNTTISTSPSVPAHPWKFYLAYPANAYHPWKTERTSNSYQSTHPESRRENLHQITNLYTRCRERHPVRTQTHCPWRGQEVQVSSQGAQHQVLQCQHRVWKSSSLFIVYKCWNVARCRDVELVGLGQF